MSRNPRAVLGVKLVRLVGATTVAIALAACSAAGAASPRPGQVDPTETPASPSPTAPPSPTATPAPTMPPLPTIGSLEPEAVFVIDHPPGALVEADGAVWAGDGSAITRIDPSTGATNRIDIRDADGIRRSGGSFVVAFDSLWVADWDFGKLYRLDKASGAVQATLEVPGPTDLVATEDAIWITNHHDGTVSRVDPATNAVSDKVNVTDAGESGPHELLVDGDNLWVGIPKDRTVARIDLPSRTLAATVSLAAPADPCGGLLRSADRLFITGCWSTPGLTEIDAASSTAVGSVAAPGPLNWLTLVGDSVWGAMESSDSTAGGSLVNLSGDDLALGKSIPVAGGYPNALLEAFGSVWLAVDEPETGAAVVLRLPTSEFSPGS
jgi:YVTN family beta-propeller protein